MYVCYCSHLILKLLHHYYNNTYTTSYIILPLPLPLLCTNTYYYYYHIGLYLHRWLAIHGYGNGKVVFKMISNFFCKLLWWMSNYADMVFCCQNIFIFTKKIKIYHMKFKLCIHGYCTCTDKIRLYRRSGIFKSK